MNYVSTLKAYVARAFVAPVVTMLMAGIAATMAMSPVQASAETRSLKLYYVHTGERAEIAFKRDGRFLPDGLKKLNVFLRDWRRNEPTKMDPRLFDLIWQVYKSTGSREYIHVVSAYRSPATNAMLRSRTKGVAKKSQHMLGHAMDYFIPGVPLAKLRGIGMRYQIGGVGYYPRSGSPFVHMDVGNVRSWPRMSRRELLALFPDGKTAHLPADGQPLPGYQAAMAMIQQRKGSSGDVLMASNSAPRKRSTTLFGALFGGGADEDEDNSDAETAPSRAPARAVARPGKPIAPAVAPDDEGEPAAPPPQQQQQPARETMIAALPARNAPTPVDAPRPDAAVQPQQETVAMNVPLPMRKPQMPVAEPLPNTLDSQAAGGTQVAAADMEPAQQPAMLNGFVPIPAMRPETAADPTLVASVVPTPRPVRPGEEPRTGQDAIAALVGEDQTTPVVAEASDLNVPASQPGNVPTPTSAERTTQVAMLPRKDEVAELIAPPDDVFPDNAAQQEEKKPFTPARAVAKVQPSTATPAAAKRATASEGDVETGVKTTAKSGRFAAKTPASKPRAVVMPASAPVSELAMSNEPVSTKAPVINPVLRNDAMRTAPTVVYTGGFQQGELPEGRANKFQGNAVTFLSVAKFSQTN